MTPLTLAERTTHVLQTHIGRIKGPSGSVVGPDGETPTLAAEPRMNANGCSSGFPARDLSSATGCLQIAAAGRVRCPPRASREDAVKTQW